MTKKFLLFTGWKLCLLFSLVFAYTANASSHREAPLIANDPLADNTDVYAFKSPDDPEKIVIIANYIPFQLPDGGPNYYTFGSNIRYEIHIKNKAANPTVDDITYRFTFTQTNMDPTTFFNIRLGQQNLKTTYTLAKSTNGGVSFTNIITNGVVPPNNIGPRSIDNTTVGLGTPYSTLMTNAITPASSTTEQVFCGPIDDPFFVDLAGAFDIGNFRPEFNATNNNTVNPPKDGLARFNVHTIAMKIPVNLLHQANKTVAQRVNILDSSFVIGVWASASRQAITTLASGTSTPSGNYVQVSRLGMPLTNEAIIPIGFKDRWNTVKANTSGEAQFTQFYKNPELALYMADGAPYFGTAVPSLNALRIQKHSLGNPNVAGSGYDFRNGKAGLFAAKGAAGTAFALSPAGFGEFLLPDNASPRAVDILPIFTTGVPNLIPYQLATGKAVGNPLTAGKPFINNFLPTFGDMLRLNMAVPATPRTDATFSSLGLLQAAVLGLTTAPYNTSTTLEFIPNMDGFPNGRRLEDDVTTIELQAVGGVVLAAIGLYYDDYTSTNSAGGITPNLLNVLNFNAGPTKNDTTFKVSFPFVQTPWRGYDYTLKPRF